MMISKSLAQLQDLNPGLLFAAKQSDTALSLHHQVRLNQDCIQPIAIRLAKRSTFRFHKPNLRVDCRYGCYRTRFSSVSAQLQQKRSFLLCLDGIEAPLVNNFRWQQNNKMCCRYLWRCPAEFVIPFEHVQNRSRFPYKIHRFTLLNTLSKMAFFFVIFSTKNLLRFITK
ncbi:Uncharacterised protein [uncultured archaeon]|nr:Uncharacterised protein [uncultured archaeon]